MGLGRPPRSAGHVMSLPLVSFAAPACSFRRPSRTKSRGAGDAWCRRMEVAPCRPCRGMACRPLDEPGRASPAPTRFQSIRSSLLADRHPETRKCHSERSKESCTAAGRPPLRTRARFLASLGLTAHLEPLGNSKAREKARDKTKKMLEIVGTNSATSFGINENVKKRTQNELGFCMQTVTKTGLLTKIGWRRRGDAFCRHLCAPFGAGADIALECLRCAEGAGRSTRALNVDLSPRDIRDPRHRGLRYPAPSVGFRKDVKIVGTNSLNFFRISECFKKRTENELSFAQKTVQSGPKIRRWRGQDTRATAGGTPAPQFSEQPYAN